MKCLNGSCDKPALYRGLCHPCYNAFNRIINCNSFTWEELIEKGLAAPKQVKVKQPKEAKQAGKVGRPGKFTDEEFRSAALEYDAAYQGNKKTIEYYKGFLEAQSSRLTEWQKEDIEKMLQPFLMKEQDRLWREKRASENSQSNV
jgi:hypothetical protein